MKCCVVSNRNRPGISSRLVGFRAIPLSIKSQNHNSFSITVSIGIWRGAKAYVVTFFYFCYIRYLLGQCQKESTKYCLTCEFRNKLRAKKTMSLNPPTMNALSFSCWNRSIHMHQAWWPSGLLSWGSWTNSGSRNSTAPHAILVENHHHRFCLRFIHFIFSTNILHLSLWYNTCCVF